MYNETTLTVNVDATSKKLSDTAVNMWIANEVVLELDQPDAPDVESGKSFYAQMTKKVLSNGAQGVTDGYYFTFDTGDVFFSATANGYPELVGDSLNIGTDTPSPSPSGGGVLKVTASYSGNDVVLDKNWTEISEAFENGIVCIYQTTADGIACDFVISTESFTDGGETYFDVYTVLGRLDAFGYRSNSATGVLVKTNDK